MFNNNSEENNMSNYSSSEKMVVKNNRKVFYNEGSYVINNILVKKGDEISFSDLKKIFRSNRLLRELYSNISNVGKGRKMYYEFYDFGDRYKINVYGMIKFYMNDLHIVKKGSRLFLIKEDFRVLRDKGFRMLQDNEKVNRWEEKKKS